MIGAIDGCIKSPQGDIYYQKHGSGDMVFITFHGFGQAGIHLKSLNKIGEDYTIYYFDLPHHGQSQWLEDHCITKEEVGLMFKKFFAEEGIDRFCVAGFSLGGKFLLTLLEYFPHKVDRIILIAPDGLKTNVWYKLATTNWLVKWLFRSMVESPSFYFNMAELLGKLGLLDDSLIKFVRLQMDTFEKRQLVYRVWMNYKDLKFNESEIVSILNTFNIPTYLYLGIYDRVIPSKDFYRFIRRVNNITNFDIESGHNHLVEKVADRIRSDFY